MGCLGLEGRIRLSKEELNIINRREKEFEKNRKEAQKRRANKRARIRRHLKSLPNDKLVDILMKEWDGTESVGYYLLTKGLISVTDRE